MTELLITSKIPGKLIYWKVPNRVIKQLNDNGDYQLGYTNSWRDTAVGQTFIPKVKDRIWKVVFKMRKVVYPTPDITLKLYECDADGLPSTHLTDLATKSPSDIPATDAEVTFECQNSLILDPDKRYAVVCDVGDYYSDADYYVMRRYGNVYPDGCLVRYYQVETEWSWGKTSYDLYFRIYLASQVVTPDVGCSEAYVLAIEYLEDDTVIKLNDEITLTGDMGDRDDLPTQILVPFRKAEWVGGSVKFYGVGIP